jgi:putative Holliday junction resolvase
MSVSERNQTQLIRGPILGLDLGQKRVGVALSDELFISIKRLNPLARTSWKRLLIDVLELVRGFDAKTLVIGLPLKMDGEHGEAAREAERVADKFARSIGLPVYLQDERLTTVEAAQNLKAEGLKVTEIDRLIDSESAAIILRDFITTHEPLLNP